MGGWLSERPGRFPPGKDPVPNVQEAGWTSGWVWTCIENLAPTGICLPERPARSNSLYRLRYRHSSLPSEILTTVNPTCHTLVYKIERNGIKLRPYVCQPIHTNHRRTIYTSWKVQKPVKSVISSFPREVDENCARLGYCTASGGSFLPMLWCNLSVPSSGFN